MMAVQNVSPSGSDCNFVVGFLAEFDAALTASTNYCALFHEAGALAHAAYLRATALGDAGTYTVDVLNKTLRVKILDYANRAALAAQLKTWFKRGSFGPLVVTMSDDELANDREAANGCRRDCLRVGFSAIRGRRGSCRRRWVNP